MTSSAAKSITALHQDKNYSKTGLFEYGRGFMEESRYEKYLCLSPDTTQLTVGRQNPVHSRIL